LMDAMPPFQAGLKVGDKFTAIDGTKVESAESFRRTLRKARARDESVFDVRRGEQTLTVHVPFRQLDPKDLPERRPNGFSYEKSMRDFLGPLPRVAEDVPTKEP